VLLALILAGIVFLWKKLSTQIETSRHSLHSSLLEQFGLNEQALNAWMKAARMEATANLTTLQEALAESLLALKLEVYRLDDAHIAHYEQMWDAEDDRHSQVIERMAAILDAVMSQNQELSEHASRLTAHAKQIIDARSQHEGNVHVPRAKCTQCDRVVFRFAVLEEKVVCQDCVSQGKGIPIPPPRPRQITKRI
jgi:hypothetical protein